ncbi:MAG TPA: sigma-70 family RNA polymerase sigma factor [Patescibacteria group bacterium]|nr:sigma-70 family RNA polymerase sigma factor [Patescibacteria group bacterium]
MSHWETSDESTLSAYLERIGAPQCAPLPRRVEEQFARWWKQSGNTTLAHELVRSNLRLVVQIAREFRRSGVPFIELIEVGNYGLLLAFQKFNPRRKRRLSTYADERIRAEIKRFILKQRWMVPVGTTTLERRLISYGTSAQRDVEAELNGEATESAINEQLGKKFGASPTKVQLVRARLDARDSSLHVPLSAHDKRPLLDLIADERNPSPEEAAITQELRRTVRKRLERLTFDLTPLERRILRERLLADKPTECAELGNYREVQRVQANLKERLRQLFADLRPKRRPRPTASPPRRRGSKRGRRQRK